MRHSLSKVLNVAFEKALLARVKTAERVPLPSGPPASLAWLIGRNAGVTAYVIMCISPRDDKFTIELAWSRHGRIPDHTGKMPGEEEDTGQLRFRMSRLWQPNGFEIWYDLQHDGDSPISGAYSPSAPEEGCVRRIPSKVAQAIDQLEKHGLPYLEKALERP